MASHKPLMASRVRPNSAKLILISGGVESAFHKETIKINNKPTKQMKVMIVK